MATTSSPAPDNLLHGLFGIEGTESDDLLVGAPSNVADYVIYGYGGNDTLVGAYNNDTLDGGAGNDLLIGGDGADYLNGGDDSDTLIGGTGADILIGGNGVDWADYIDSTAAVQVDLSIQTAQHGGDAEGDQLSGIENLKGTNYNDALTGDAGNNWLRGQSGDDILEGGGGADDLNGGYGIDTASYAHASRGVTIDLNQGAQSGSGEENGDGLWSIENVTGSQFGDVLLGADGSTTASTGNGVDNVLMGLGGDDLLDGRRGNDSLYGGNGNDTLIGGEGNDFLDGGAGVDTAVYSGKLSDYKVEQLDTSSTNPYRITDLRTGAVDMLTNVEGLRFNDVTCDISPPNQMTGMTASAAVVLAQGVAALQPTVTATSGSPTASGAQTDVLAYSVTQPVPC